MKTELKVVTNQTEHTEVATVAHSDPLAAYANAVAPQYIIGEMLRFSKGDWIAGKDNTIPVGTTFTVAPTELLAGWIQWLNSKPVSHEMVRVEDGIPPKKREELGDTDASQWPVDKDGKPKDVWQFTNYLPMMDEDGKVYTFTTSSRGGITAVAQLLRLFANHRKRHPDVFPVIKINTDSYQHKDRDLGRIKYPVFEPAGYLPKGDFLAALAEAGHTAAEAAPAATESADDEFNDSIPSF
jgi:hypothetical protein